jgi:hypothetical protein
MVHLFAVPIGRAVLAGVLRKQVTPLSLPKLVMPLVLFCFFRYPSSMRVCSTCVHPGRLCFPTVHLYAQVVVRGVPRENSISIDAQQPRQPVGRVTRADLMHAPFPHTNTPSKNTHTGAHLHQANPPTYNSRKRPNPVLGLYLASGNRVSMIRYTKLVFFIRWVSTGGGGVNMFGLASRAHKVTCALAPLTFVNANKIKTDIRIALMAQFHLPFAPLHTTSRNRQARV